MVNSPGCDSLSRKGTVSSFPHCIVQIIYGFAALRQPLAAPSSGKRVAIVANSRYAIQNELRWFEQI
ncbi:hypothetical protein M422DRAFT_259380 [Sphaerobolus stellatus SS14]|uniref:Unplaced genomic scaffold SPHSTscaffold_89, whole genome shotgun sequence n=1 Tax=Sphaerobolus stellatus (strain SS14) TaxID=990650 RepID=A0A0C9VKK6_SPHS4|nr:hypothetical protein M422DRAFT_259380 [Sphaerobolus stellatus SS14]